MKNNNELIAFMSIKPAYARKLISGEKKYEYRKTSINENITHIIIYSTSPEKKILGIAEVATVRSASPTATWERTKLLGGITRKLFREYFKNKKTAYAIEVKNILAFDELFSPAEIDEGFTVPQSFSYVSREFFGKALTKGLGGASYSRKLVFVGGIHGVGKSTMCAKAAKKMRLEYLSASGLINDYKSKIMGNVLSKRKLVKDININQNILIRALNEVPSNTATCLFDGHFTLIDMNGKIKAVPEIIFKQINPISILIIVDDPNSIAKKLKLRDRIKYDAKIIQSMQEKELKQAYLVGRHLKIDVHEVSCNDFAKFSKIISAFKENKETNPTH